MCTVAALLGIIPANIDGVIGRGLGLPRVITVIALHEFHILKVTFLHGEILRAGPAVQLRATLKLAAHAAMRAD